jgi:hypothetical protein
MSKPKKVKEVELPYKCKNSNGCPYDTVAYTVQEIQKKFFWRTMEDGTQRPQPYCIQCNKDRGH